MEQQKITILGAGLVGSLLSLLLTRKGFDVSVYEKRQDPRTAQIDEGRSINLALSHRGIRALEKADAYRSVVDRLIPMKGRMMHDQEGVLSFQPYGRSGQHINSVSRTGLNKELIAQSEAAGTTFYFEHKCVSINPDETDAIFEHGHKKLSAHSDVLIGADGANSILRKTLKEHGHLSDEETYIDHGYKELTIHPNNNDFALEPNYLHIWPRGNFMLIALPNPDKSFTCTLFFPFTGSTSFESLDTDSKICHFFKANFPDVIPVMPNYLDQFHTSPTSHLVSVKTHPWSYKNTLLIGDSSHAIVPFYGQGMNAGFEDCRLLMEWGEKLNFDWARLLRCFTDSRKKDTDAIAELAMNNFVEMRDRVADTRFLAIKTVERRLQKEYPETWIPLYTMVTFTDIPYDQALQIGRIQAKIMEGLPEDFNPEMLDLEPLIQQFQKQIKNT